MKTKITNPAVRLQEIREEMLALLNESESLVRKSGNKRAYSQARSYWLPHIKMSLTNKHEYLGDSMCSMEDTIDSLNGFDDE